MSFINDQTENHQTGRAAPPAGFARQTFSEKKLGGFTLIEMLVVIAMIGILSAVVLTALGPSRAKAKDARIISDVNQARAIAETYYDPTSATYSVSGIRSATVSTSQDAAQNGDGTQGLAFVFTPAGDPAATAFAIYGKLNSGGTSVGPAWFCSDSTGVTKQVNLAGYPDLPACP